MPATKSPKKIPAAAKFQTGEIAGRKVLYRIVDGPRGRTVVVKRKKS